MQRPNCKLRIRVPAIGIGQFALCRLQSLFYQLQFSQSVVVVSGMLVGAVAASAVRGDVFELAGGGRVEGRVLESADEFRSTIAIELDDGGLLKIPRSQVTRIESYSADELEYHKLARSLPDNVDAHLKLAEWCRERRLRDEAQRHWERILELEPNHEAARAALGFRHKDGQWMTRDDVMESRGLVLYGGRYVAPQHVELMERQKQTKISQADWANHLEQLRRWLTGRRQDRAAEALAEIQQIRDPLAAEAVVGLLRREEDPRLRRLWIEVASRLNHRTAVDLLIELSLTDADPEIRHDCLELLVKSGRPGLAKFYIRALNDADNEIVNRAAAALARIGDRDAINPLINALITKHRFKVGDGNPDQHAYAFSPDGGAFSFGGGGPQIITQSIRNPEVLSALVTLSGGPSFDYNQQQWRRWLATQAKLQAVDVRRDQ